MAAHSRTGVLIAGLILIGLGTLFMVHNFFEISAWRVIVRYWPVILILVGARKIYGYFAWRELPPAPAAASKE